MPVSSSPEFVCSPDTSHTVVQLYMVRVGAATLRAGNNEIKQALAKTKESEVPEKNQDEKSTLDTFK